MEEGYSVRRDGVIGSICIEDGKIHIENPIGENIEIDESKINKSYIGWGDFKIAYIADEEELKKELKELVAKEGTFEWALIQMKKGKKVKRNDSNHFYFIDHDGIIQNNYLILGFSLNNVLANDWQKEENETTRI